MANSSKGVPLIEGDTTPSLTSEDVLRKLPSATIVVTTWVGGEDRDLGRTSWSVRALVDFYQEDDDEEKASLPGVALGMLDRPDDTDVAECVIFEMNGYTFNEQLVPSLMIALDADANTADLLPVGVGGEGWFGPEALRLAPGYGPLVAVDKVLLAEAWRGKGIAGRYLFDAALAVVASDLAGAVALVPSPFHLDYDDPGRDAAKKKLVAFWKSMGFVKMCGSDVMVADLQRVDFAVRAHERHGEIEAASRASDFGSK